MKWLAILPAAIAAIAMPAFSHRIEDSHGTLRFDAGRAYLVLSMPRVILTTGQPIETQIHGCLSLISNGHSVPLEGVLVDAEVGHEGYAGHTSGSEFLTVMGVYRNVTVSSVNSFGVGCFGNGVESNAYPFVFSSSDGWRHSELLTEQRNVIDFSKVQVAASSP